MDEILIITFWIIAAFMACMLVFKIWGDSIYLLIKNWKAALATLMLLALVCLVSLKHDNLKYEMADYIYKVQTPDDIRIASTIATCKNFVQAKTEDRATDEYRTISAGIFNISNISYWEICADTFGRNYWKYDISINGQNGGYLLCNAYARTPYRNGKVNAWCNTVFSSAPSPYLHKT